MNRSNNSEFRASSASPSAPRHVDSDAPIETTEQLRIAIDSGRGGDKIDAVDPAASPLGTDDEAAGTPPTIAAVRQAAMHEVRARPDGPKTNSFSAVWFLIAVFLTVGIGIACTLLFI